VAVSQVLEIPYVPMKNPTQGRNAIRQVFERLGDTPFFLKTLRLSARLSFIPISTLNQIRRALTEELAQKLETARQGQIDSFIRDVDMSEPDSSGSASSSRWLLKTDQPSALLDVSPELLKSMKEIILVPTGEDLVAMDCVVNHLAAYTSIRISIPLLMRSWERARIQAMIQHFEKRGQQLWEVGNVYALSMLDAHQNKWDITANWPLYTLNGSAAKSLFELGIRRFTFAPEDTLENKIALAMKYPNRGEWPILRDVPLFISEACPLCATPCGGVRPTCQRPEIHWRHSSGEKITTYSKYGRAVTLFSQPQYPPSPPRGLPVLLRADFLFRPWDAETMSEILQKLFGTSGNSN
jgi:hypothetical protein